PRDHCRNSRAPKTLMAKPSASCELVTAASLRSCDACAEDVLASSRLLLNPSHDVEVWSNACAAAASESPAESAATDARVKRGPSAPRAIPTRARPSMPFATRARPKSRNGPRLVDRG